MKPQLQKWGDGKGETLMTCAEAQAEIDRLRARSKIAIHYLSEIDNLKCQLEAAQKRIVELEAQLATTESAARRMKQALEAIIYTSNADVFTIARAAIGEES